MPEGGAIPTYSIIDWTALSNDIALPIAALSTALALIEIITISRTYWRIYAAEKKHRSTMEISMATRSHWRPYAAEKKHRSTKQISKVTRLSRTQTGYVGAFITKYTVTVTLLILAISISLFAFNVLRSLQNSQIITRIAMYGISFFVVTNLLVVLYITTFVLRVCRKIVSQVEEDDNHMGKEGT